jgi:cytochrome o ubiquinol oxidase operon protein cyoD
MKKLETRRYISGFALSLGLTLVAYLFVVQGWAHGWTLIYVLAALAIIQLFVQLMFFLHLGREAKPRWNLTVLSFAAIIVSILVFGSLWIMKNLSYGHTHTPPPAAIIKDEGYKP